MKKTKLIAGVLALLLALSMFAGCAQSGDNDTTPSDSPSPSDNIQPSAAPSAAGEPETSPDAEPAIKFTDMTGREIALDKPATKIVALTAADCEILYALGAGDTVIGRGEYCNYPDAALSVTEVSSGGNTNVEQIIALQPDAVVMDTMAQTTEQIEALENAGITVVVSRAVDINGVYDAINQIGMLTGKTTEAEALISNMKASFDDIRTKAAEAKGDEEKTVYFEVSPLEYGLWTAGTDTFMDELATMLGLTNIFADVSGWAEISEEQVLQRNPDYIVTNAMYFGDGEKPEEEILGRAGWDSITAIANGKVFNADADAVSRPGPRLVDAAQMLYDFVYGE